ncbi:MAG: PIN domain-containing protein [Acidimicrobiales bacterium]
MSVCLDSWAVLRWLEGAEPAAGRVEEALAERPVMSWINLGEVYCVLRRAVGADQAAEVVRDLRRRVEVELPDEVRVLEEAAIKADHRLAYADAFALATAMAHGARLYTGDPELVDGPEDWPIEDLRPV